VNFHGGRIQTESLDPNTHDLLVGGREEADKYDQLPV
jgi:hypothetical protein